MEIDLLTAYDNFTLGVAAYKRINKNQFRICYMNDACKALDNLDSNYLGSYLHEVFPEIVSFGLIEQLESVYETNEQLILPFKAYESHNGNIIYRANKLKKLGEDIILNIYNDESETYAYIRDMKDNNLRLNKALSFISHDIRGEVTTSLGLIELLKHKCNGKSEVGQSLQIIQKNMETIDFKIHALVNILFQKSSEIEEIQIGEHQYNAQ